MISYVCQMLAIHTMASFFFFFLWNIRRNTSERRCMLTYRAGTWHKNTVERCNTVINVLRGTITVLSTNRPQKKKTISPTQYNRHRHWFLSSCEIANIEKIAIFFYLLKTCFLHLIDTSRSINKNRIFFKIKSKTYISFQTRL